MSVVGMNKSGSGRWKLANEVAGIPSYLGKVSIAAGQQVLAGQQDNLTR